MKRTTSQRGMTLMEAMASMAILAIGVSGAVGITTSSARSVSRSAHVQMSTMLAENLLSTLMAVPWNANPNLFANTNAGNDGDVADVDTGPGWQSKFAPNLLSTSQPFDHCLDTSPPAPTTSCTTAEITGTLATLLMPLPTDPRAPGRSIYERYWNIAPIAGTNAVTIAVVVRWHEAGRWSRVVLLGTRYQP
jgi:prepilin-type N-terminal cleavage/methylation domain-containing protein